MVTYSFHLYFRSSHHFILNNKNIAQCPQTNHSNHAVSYVCFPRMAPVACLPALGTGCMFTRPWHRLHVFLRLTPVASLPALGTVCMFSRAWHRLHVLLRLAWVARFPTLGKGYTFSRAWQCLHVFPHLAPVVCFSVCFELSSGVCCDVHLWFGSGFFRTMSLDHGLYSHCHSRWGWLTPSCGADDSRNEVFARGANVTEATSYA